MVPKFKALFWERTNDLFCLLTGSQTRTYVVGKNHNKSMYEFNLESVFLPYLKKKALVCRFSGGHAKNLPKSNTDVAETPCLPKTF